MEIQIRSMLQHAWAEIEHDLEYKNPAGTSMEVRRPFQPPGSLAGNGGPGIQGSSPDADGGSYAGSSPLPQCEKQFQIEAGRGNGEAAATVFSGRFCGRSRAIDVQWSRFA